MRTMLLPMLQLLSMASLLAGLPCPTNSLVASSAHVDVVCPGESPHIPFTPPLADISFVVLDLKYNAQDGVKICEMQSGRESQFKGYDFLTGGEGFVPNLFYKILTGYQRKLWWVDGDFNDQGVIHKFAEGATKIANLDQLQNDNEFLRLSSLPVEDPRNLHDYQGVICAKSIRFSDLQGFQKKYPAILVLDAAFIPYFKNKATMDRLLQKSPKLNALRPRFRLCPKKYSRKLAREIEKELESELLVIKPIHTAEGHGVIIIQREDLDGTLKYILAKENRSALLHCGDKSYSHWAHDHEGFFLVEEFAFSDPVQVPHFNNACYDGTMRVVVMLIYQLGKLEIHLLEGHWKLPKKSIADIGSLNEKHKSHASAPYFCSVDTSVLEQVQQQLSDAFEELYQSRF